MRKTRKCPVCFSKQISKSIKAPNQHGQKTLKEKESFSYFKCGQCGIIYLDGFKIDNAYYQTYYSFPEANKKSIALHIIEKRLDKFSNYKKRMLVNQYCVSKHKKIAVLDIGCGSGNFLASLDKATYNAVGIERDRKEFLICKQKKLNVHCSDILTSNMLGKKFDVITMWHVIEHIQDPHKLLKRVNKLLKQDGVVIMTSPNCDSLGYKLAKERWFHFDAPRHLILYGKNGVEKLSLNNGFRIKKTYSQIFEFPLDLYWSIKQLKIKYLVYPIYPLMKYISRETLTYVLEKN